MKRDLGFAKLVVAINCAIPASLLAWDALRGQLGTNGVNYALRTTGMLALIFLMLSLAVTPVRRITGWSAVLSVRRTLGLYAFFHVVAHFTIFFVFDRGLSIKSTVQEILTRTYLQIGTIAFVLLVPLAVTSTDRMIQRLGPKRWKALHRLVYLIAIGGVLHFYLLVKADHTKPLIFAYTLGALFAFRLAFWILDRRARVAHPRVTTTPASKRRRFSGELVVARIFEETPDVRTFRLMSPSGGDLPFDYSPGQYLNISLSIDNQRVRRSYTIASSPTRSAYCEITVKREDDGLGSRHLHDRVREGTRVEVSAPAGKFVFTGENAGSVVLIAGGVGITPIMSIVRYLTDTCWSGKIHLVYSARSERDIVFREEIATLTRRFPNLHVVITLTRDEGKSWSGARGRINRALLDAIGPELALSPAYVCGPTEMIAETSALLAKAGVPAVKIFTEVFVSPQAPLNRVAGTEVIRDGSVRSETVDSDRNLDEAIEELTETPTVTFESSDRVADAPAGKTILEAAEDAGVDIPFECRAGICGQCKTRLLSGLVRMDSEDALSDDDRARGIVLACQAHPRGDVTVEA